MKVSTSIEISKPKEDVWKVITDIENCQGRISSILAIEVLEKPEAGFVGFKWKETRKMFGKEATEIMWVTDSVENEYYSTRAESHGSVYVSQLSLAEANGVTTLTFSFSGEAQTLVAKVLSALMGFMIKGSMKKELQKDLQDIKIYVEQN
ncbi:MAG: SRPBCC family protein [Gammaproteobacteria bacterium]|nr:SRPBCC family protein [Gammaproteobacteria bacterium]MBT8076287.1 SRPBCC family protein [Gammaproteobacteria bacterium]